MKSKRLIIATLLGLMFGFVCYGLASSGGNSISLALAICIISGRTIIGFGIGISRFKIQHWALHGLMMGLVFSIPAAFGALAGPGNPELSNTMMFTSTLFMGVLYGFLIEFITTVIFKLKQ